MSTMSARNEARLRPPAGRAPSRRRLHVSLAGAGHLGLVQEAHGPAGGAAVVGEHLGPTAHRHGGVAFVPHQSLEGAIDRQALVELRLVDLVDPDIVRLDLPFRGGDPVGGNRLRTREGEGSATSSTSMPTGVFRSPASNRQVSKAAGCSPTRPIRRPHSLPRTARAVSRSASLGTRPFRRLSGRPVPERSSARLRSNRGASGAA